MTKTMEKRLADLESRVAAIEKAPAKASTADNSWLDRWTGLYHNDPDFEDAMKLGRTYRRRQPKC